MRTMESTHSRFVNNMIYIATCYSHCVAIRFKKWGEGKGMAAKVMPVPRNLSSSCGTCVRFESNEGCPVADLTEEVEQVVEVTEKGYVSVFRAENS